MSKLGGLAGNMPYTAVISMIGALTIIGIPPTSGFMSEWILFGGVLQTALSQSDPTRVVLFGFGILTTVLSSAYILWMYKRIFFGKIPERLVNVKDSSAYITATMAVLAGLTLLLGVYPDPILNPITNYVESVFPENSGVLQLPSQNENALVKQPPEQSSSGFQQSSIGKPDSNLLDQYSKPGILTLAKGKIAGEGQQRESMARFEHTALIYSKTGASK
jgi:formate hydrogenlyase subunit 3/multisubunit Na+/H+ antiporter MnhD subunit